MSQLFRNKSKQSKIKVESAGQGGYIDELLSSPAFRKASSIKKVSETSRITRQNSFSNLSFGSMKFRDPFSRSEQGSISTDKQVKTSNSPLRRKQKINKKKKISDQSRAKSPSYTASGSENVRKPYKPVHYRKHSKNKKKGHVNETPSDIKKRSTQNQQLNKPSNVVRRPKPKVSRLGSFFSPIGKATSKIRFAEPASVEKSSMEAAEQDRVKGQIHDYFYIVDPKKLPDIVDICLEFYNTLGVKKLNEKLNRKYKVDLTNYENYQESKLRHTILEGNTQELPDNLFKILQCFYLRYDRPKAREINVKEVLRWTVKYGLPALNVQLRTNYDTDLDEFELLLTDLEECLEYFFEENDRSVFNPKANPNFTQILHWALAHGPEAITMKLESRYKVDVEMPPF
eukprot:snap_masked-scaffold_63-processed-gene-0.55-mRNA-1 protein AED:1.00 eAED:1.00 QI:0/-1/0/0/-1/1/1/0/399